MAVVSLIALTSSKPVFMAWVSSFRLWVTMLVHSSFVAWYCEFSRVI